MSKSSSGRRRDQERRRRLRRRLEGLGYQPAQIEKRVAELDAKRARMQEARARAQRLERQEAELDPEQQRREAETYARLCPDDRGFKPSTPDPLKTGPARVTGATAKVAGRRNTITKWQYDEMEGTA